MNRNIIFPCRYHPLYITDSPEGGIGQKTGLQLTEQKTYAGVDFDDEGNPIPTAGNGIFPDYFNAEFSIKSC